MAVARAPRGPFVPCALLTAALLACALPCNAWQPLQQRHVAYSSDQTRQAPSLDVVVPSEANGLGRASLRALQQSAEANATIVTTAEQLLAAVRRGDAHIELQAHINMIGSEPLKEVVAPNNPRLREEAVMLGVIPSSVKSIRGNCAEPVANASFTASLQANGLPRLGSPRSPLRELHSGQCLLISPLNLLQVANGPLWLDGLYVRFYQSSTDDVRGLVSALAEVRHGGRLFLTGSVLQGDATIEAHGESVGSLANQAGLHVLGGDAYLADTVFEGFGGFEWPLWVNGTGATALLQQCTFENNPVGGYDTFRLATELFNGNCVVIASGFGALHMEAATFKRSGGVGYLCAVSGPAVEQIEDSNSGGAAASVSELGHPVENGVADLTMASFEGDATLDLSRHSAARGAPDLNSQCKADCTFLTDDDPWFVAVQQELPALASREAGVSSSRALAVASQSRLAVVVLVFGAIAIIRSHM